MNTAEEKISRLHSGGVIDLHFDLPLILFLSRPRRNFVATDFLPEFEAGDIGVLGVALYVEDQYRARPITARRARSGGPA